jgi:hypothetical protein
MFSLYHSSPAPEKVYVDESCGYFMDASQVKDLSLLSFSFLIL